MQNLKSRVYFLMITFLCSPLILANTSKINRWSQNAVREGQNLGIGLGSAMLAVAGLLFMLGSQFAGELLKKIVTGIIVMLGAGGIATVFQAIITR
jgi:hypothetical protein